MPMPRDLGGTTGYQRNAYRRCGWPLRYQEHHNQDCDCECMVLVAHYVQGRARICSEVQQLSEDRKTYAYNKMASDPYHATSTIREMEDRLCGSYTTSHEVHLQTLHPSGNILCDQDGRGRSYSQRRCSNGGQILFELIITRYGCSLELVSDQGTHFLNEVIKDLTYHFQIKHGRLPRTTPRQTV